MAAILGAIVCALAIYESARVGFARTYAATALATTGQAVAEKSVRLLPNDAEVHAARGVVLQRAEEYPEASRELERAVQLRPRDYFLWVMLAITRDLNGDQSGAIAAFRQSVELAPSYAKPRWFFGNLLLRTGQIDEAFAQLRLAEESDSSLLPAVIDLAWGVSTNNPANTIALIRPRSDDGHMGMAIFLAAHQQGTAALDEFHKVSVPPTAAADQLINRLIEARSFVEAFEVWKQMHCSVCKSGSFVNGGFENDIDIDAHGFDWQIAANTPGIIISMDTAQHESGGRSLHLDFHGNSSPQIALISQTIIVDPQKHYRISLQAMTRSYVSAAGPMVRVVDASDAKLVTLGQVAIATDASNWRPYSIPFSAGPGTRAVRVIVNRSDCPMADCGAFGTLWLDSFQISEETAR